MFDIIIPHFGPQSLLERCLSSVITHTTLPHKLIIMDNNHRNNGFASSINMGIQLGSGTYTVLLNNDTIVCPDWLDSLWAVSRQDPKIAVVGPLSSASTQWQGVENVKKWLGIALPTSGYITSDEYQFPSRLAFWCVLIPRRFFDKVGLLDEQFFMYGEDDDWCLRAQEKGFRAALDLSIVVHHTHRTNYNAESQRHHHESRVRFKKKWGTVR